MAAQGLWGVPREYFQDGHVIFVVKLLIEVLLELVVPDLVVGTLVGEVVYTLVLQLVGELEQLVVLCVDNDAVRGHGSRSHD